MKCAKVLIKHGSPVDLFKWTVDFTYIIYDSCVFSVHVQTLISSLGHL